MKLYQLDLLDKRLWGFFFQVSIRSDTWYTIARKVFSYIQKM